MATDGARKGGGDRRGKAARPSAGFAPQTQEGPADGPAVRETARTRHRIRGGGSGARGVVLLLLAIAALFLASAFLDAGPREGGADGTRGGRVGAEAPGKRYVPPGTRCGDANLCDEAGGAQQQAPLPAAEPERVKDGW